jgi:hypothetical protein
MKTRWQVRDPSFGLALRDAELGWMAIADVIVASERGDIAAQLKNVTVEADGTVSATYRGKRFYAIPVSEDATDSLGLDAGQRPARSSWSQRSAVVRSVVRWPIHQAGRSSPSTPRGCAPQDSVSPSFCARSKCET